MTPPTTPIITGYSTDTAIIGDDITADGALIFFGTGEAGASLELSANGDTVAFLDVIPASGNWSVQIGEGRSVPAASEGVLADSVYEFSAGSRDADGTPSALSNRITITVDGPNVSSVDLISDTESNTADDITTDATPTIQFTADIGDALSIDWGDGNGFVTAGTATGAVQSFTKATSYLGPLLNDENIVITVRATKEGVNTEQTLSFVLDRVSEAPSGTLAVNSDTGTSQTDQITSDNTPTFSGTAEAGARINLIADGGAGSIAGTTIVNASGEWSITTSTLEDGAHTFVAEAVDRAANISPLSSNLEVTVDTSAPVQPSVTLADVSRVNVTGTDNTNGATPVFEGTAEAGSIVEISVGGNVIGATTANASNEWTFTPATDLADGTLSIAVTARDTAGNTSQSSDAISVIVDTTPPAAPVITGFSGDSGTTTEDMTPTLNGTAEPLSTVDIYRDNMFIASESTGSDGAWAHTSPALANGSYTFTATATDGATNVSGFSAGLTFEVVTRPNAPTLDLLVSSDTGTSDSDDLTNDSTLDLIGTAEAGSTVEIFDGSTSLGTTIADGTTGEWSFSTAALSDGDKTLSATSTNASNLTSAPSLTLNVIIDTTAPILGTPLAQRVNFKGASAAAGDFNGDGANDLLLGYIFGNNSGVVDFAGFFDANAVERANISQFAAGGDGYRFVLGGDITGNGYGMDFVGDIDGDGRDDMLISVILSSGQGHQIIVRSADLETLDQLDGADDNNIDLSVARGSPLTHTVEQDTRLAVHGIQSRASDLLGDLSPELILSSEMFDSSFRSLSGNLHIIDPDALAALEAASASADNYILTPQLASVGVAYTIGDSGHLRTGDHFSAGGTVQGLGSKDLLIGSEGAVHLLSGAQLAAADTLDGADGLIDLSLTSGTTYGTEFIYGASQQVIQGDFLGDIDGDGREELAFSTFVDGRFENILITSTAYDVLKPSDTVDLATLTPGGGIYRIEPPADNQFFGFHFLSLGDVDGDGIDDIGIASSFISSTTGMLFVLSGAKVPTYDAVDGTTDGIINLGGLIGQDGVYRIDARSSYATNFSSLTRLGDFDLDGFDDFSANDANSTHIFSGAKLADLDAGDGTADGVIKLANLSGLFSGGIVLDASSDSGMLGDNLTNDTTPTLSGQAEPDAIVIITLDNVEIGRVTTDATGAWSYTDAMQLADGNYAYSAQTADAAGNLGAPQSLDITIDTVGTPQPQNYSFYDGQDGSIGIGGALGTVDDIDGDGLNELLIGSPMATEGNATNSGSVFVVMSESVDAADAADGARDGAVDLRNTLDEGSYLINGSANFQQLSRYGLVGLGDVIGDAAPEFIIGSNSNANAYAIINGAELAALDAADGTTDNTISTAQFASASDHTNLRRQEDVGGSDTSIAEVADIDSDGKSDFLLGSNLLDAPGVNSGGAYLVTSTALAAAQISNGNATLADILAKAGTYRFNGENDNSQAGRSVASGDLTGTADLVIGTIEGGIGGAFYVIDRDALATIDALDGTTDSIVDLGLVADQGDSYKFTGAYDFPRAGDNISIDDVTGDGQNDMLFVGSYNGNEASRPSFWLFSGDQFETADLADSVDDNVIDMGEIAGLANSYEIVAERVPGNSFMDVRGELVGDTDGDGLADLLLTQQPSSSANTSLTWLLSSADLAAADAADGSNDGLIELTDLSGLNSSYRFEGAEVGDNLGASIAEIGDWNEDGLADFAIAAPNISGSSGAVYTVVSSSLDAADAVDGVVDGQINLGNWGNPLQLISASDTGSSQSDLITNETTPTVTYIGAPGTQIEIDFGNGDGFVSQGQATGEVQSFTAATPYSTDGPKTISVRATDAAANVGLNTLDITVDTVGPALLMTGLTSDTGASQTDLITNDTSVFLSGRTDVGALVEVYINDELRSTQSTDGVGQFGGFTQFTLTEGAQTVEWISRDVAGNGLSSGVQTVVLDTMADEPGAVTAISDDTGTSDSDFVTSDVSLTFSGTGVAGNAFTLFVDGQNFYENDDFTVFGEYGSGIIGPDGTWSVDVTVTDIDEGDHNVFVRTSDLAGNAVSSETVAFTVDTSAPITPTLELNTASDTGVSNNDNVTADTTPTLSGTAEAGSVVEIFRDDTSLGSVMADSTGNWSFTTASLGIGNYSFTAVSRDLAGNASDTSTMLDVTINFAPPVVPSTPENQAPTVRLTNVVSEILRGQEVSTDPVRVASILVLDDALGEETVALTGESTDLFEIVGFEVFLKADVDLSDFVGTDLSVNVEVDDPTLGNGIEDSASLRLPVINTFFTGTDASNFFDGTPFADVFVGGFGTDTVYQSENGQGYTITFDVDGNTIEDRDTGLIDTLIGIETVIFEDELEGPTTLDVVALEGILTTPEAQLEMLSVLYISLFGRAPDAPGLFFWATQLANGAPFDEIIEYFLDSREFEIIRGTATEDADIVRQAYLNLLDRAPDIAGESFWIDALSTDAVDLSDFVFAFVAGAQPHLEDQRTVEDQIDISLYFSSIQGLSDNQDAHDVLDVYVADNPIASLENAQGLVDALVEDIEASETDSTLLVKAVGVLDSPFVVDAT